MNAPVHDFQESLQASRKYRDAPWWLAVYRSAFPDLAAVVPIDDDGWAQRAGIDRVLTLLSGRVITVDEKVREKDYGDILLEYFSDSQRKTRGWVNKPLGCDFIAYAIAPTCTCYLLPVPTLRRAWTLSGPEWIRAARAGERGFRLIVADNGRYMTKSVAVPIGVLFSGLSNAMTVRWTDAEALVESAP